MNLTQLTPDITVSDQLHPADFAELPKPLVAHCTSGGRSKALVGMLG